MSTISFLKLKISPRFSYYRYYGSISEQDRYLAWDQRHQPSHHILSVLLQYILKIPFSHLEMIDTICPIIIFFRLFAINILLIFSSPFTISCRFLLVILKWLIQCLIIILAFEFRTGGPFTISSEDFLNNFIVPLPTL